MTNQGMNEIIQIKCPFDGAILSVKNQPGIENKNVTCPICRNKYPFSRFKRVTGIKDDHFPSRINSGMENIPCNNTEEEYATQLPKMNFTMGQLQDVKTGEVFHLQLGRNIIGRKGTQSLATIQIDTGDSHSMSREHIVIEVKKEKYKGFVHYLTLYKEKVNKSEINGERLLYGDTIILSHGDKISLPDAELKFELPDDEATRL